MQNASGRLQYRLGRDQRNVCVKRLPAARRTKNHHRCASATPVCTRTEILRELQSQLKPALALRAAKAMLSPGKIDSLVAPFLGGNDPGFGFLSGLTLPQFLTIAKSSGRRAPQVGTISEGIGSHRWLRRGR